MKYLIGMLAFVMLAGAALAQGVPVEDGTEEMANEVLNYQLGLVQDASMEQGTNAPVFEIRGSAMLCEFFEFIKNQTSDGDVHYPNVTCKVIQ